MRLQTHDVFHALRAATLPGVIVALAGCGVSRSEVNVERLLARAGPIVQESDAQAPPDERAEQDTIPAAGQGQREPAPLHQIGVAEARAGVAATESHVGAPEDVAGAPTTGVESIDGGPDVAVTAAPGQSRLDDATIAPAPGRPQGERLVDALVGQINGRPVYASEFLAPIDARLRALADETDFDSWLQQARNIIRQSLVEKVRDEILLAEFQAALTPEQRMGLFAFVEQLRSQIVSESRGSVTLADERSREAQGLSLEERVALERDREMIRTQVNRAVGDRVYVSWREVEQWYERNRAQFQPPAVARLRMIDVPSDDTETLETVRAALEAGTPFADVASQHSGFNPSQGGLIERSIGSQPYSESTLFGPELLNERARALSVGGVTGPFEWNGSQVWLHLESINRPEGQTLYETQRMIFNSLEESRWAEEQTLYLQRLLDRASVTNVNQMQEKLMRIAVQRYHPGRTLPERDARGR